MAAQTDSPERIAADILIAAMQNPGDIAQKRLMSTPAEAAKNFQIIFNTVLNARNNLEKD
ncbi:hypothetical protein SAMN04488490_1832 [Marinobacter sp. LV10R510-11A]|uniref:hypothetical protein n=1 Tax=Marinobacter sp. LV10R510-11A TaxID=1415568 RepID=UPI000BB85791|nr:hypothetical protein [Marinobacter sp. LV10R510-11A]SOB76155.1 hypothetical protein SAMN04488490_1832 [Marinobacter sp. LV10R510-11A]